MPTYRLTIAYDGTAYVGWQRQAVGVSIQGLLEEALAQLDGGTVIVAGAGRTDAGVHAVGQVARATVRAPHSADVVTRALNASLPPDVRVLRTDEVPDSFHPRFGARTKRYQYWIWDRPILPPALRSWCWHVPRRLDVEAMDAAAATLVGRHDFAAFRATRSAVIGTVRTVTLARVMAVHADPGDEPSLAARLAPGGGRFVVFEIAADGFLRHMVRVLMGTLVEVGDGRRQPGSLGELLLSGDRRAAGPTAPPQGLVMMQVLSDEFCRP